MVTVIHPSFEVVPQEEAAPESRHSMWDWVFAELRTLPKGKALKIKYEDRTAMVMARKALQNTLLKRHLEFIVLGNGNYLFVKHR